MKISDLKPFMKKIEFKFNAVELTEKREVNSKLDNKTHYVREALIADESGAIYLTLWDDATEQVIPGKNYSLENGFTSLFKRSLRVNVGRFGKITELNENITANTSNMLSEEIKPLEFKEEKEE